MLHFFVQFWTLCCQKAWDAFLKVGELTGCWKWLWKPTYWLLAVVQRLGLARWQFMNLGYLPLNDADKKALKHSKSLIEAKPPEERPAIQLYERLLSVCPLFPDFEQTDMLEVGCGHAGGVLWINEAHKFRSNRGMDMNIVEDLGGQVFQGDATAIPLGDDCVDVLLNCETSHCYTDVARYMREAMRVLRPGGFHVLTDVRPAGKEEEKLWDDAKRTGFKLLQRIEITDNVIAALDKRAELESEAVGPWHMRLVKPLIRTFLIMNSRRFSNGAFKYHMACWQKPTE